MNVYKLPVESGKTYLLRIINAALNEELFYKIAGHSLTACTFIDSPVVSVDNLTAIATLQYTGTLSTTPTLFTIPPPRNATQIANDFNKSLKSLNSKKYLSKVPQTVDYSLLDLGLTIVHLVEQEMGVEHITSTFGINPSQVYNYTATPPVVASQTTNDTKAYRLAFNSTVHVVLQDTGAIAPKSLPVHLHGFNFSVVGSGVGNYDPKTNQNNFNLVDPVERNTIGVPTGGWIAFRFRADNPGVWFFHCHFEVHITGGLKMIFLVHTNKGRPSYA
ncbi:Laccase-4 [Glycine soja]